MVIINPFLFESMRMQIEESSHTPNKTICKDPFKESNRLIDNAKESYFKILKEEKCAIRESANPSEFNL